MKKLSISMLLLAAVALTVPSCKKGEEDPGLSLKSRAGRLAGDWNVSSYEKTQIDKNSSGTTTYATSHSGSGDEITKETYSNNPSQNGSDTVAIVTHTITFDKEGTFTMVKSTKETYEEFGTEEVTDITETTTGTWQFLGKSGDYKNKERLALAATSTETEVHFVKKDNSVTVADYTTTEVDNSTTTNMAVTFDLIRLSGDEVIMESIYENDYKFSTDVPGGPVTNNSSSIHEKYTLTAAE